MKYIIPAIVALSFMAPMSWAQTEEPSQGAIVEEEFNIDLGINENEVSKPMTVSDVPEILKGYEVVEKIGFEYGRYNELTPLVELLHEDTLLVKNGYAVFANKIMDLDNDNVNEVMLWFQDPYLCIGSNCPFTIAKYDQENGVWTSVLETTAEVVFLAKKTKSDAGYEVVTQEVYHSSNTTIYNRWSLDDEGVFRIPAEEYAEEVVLKSAQETPNENITNVLMRDFPEMFLILEGEDPEFKTVRWGEGDFNADGTNETFIQIDAKSQCGSVSGCPVYVYSDLESKPFFSFRNTRDRVAFSRVMKDGMKGLIYGASDGYTLFYFDKSRSDYVSQRSFEDDFLDKGVKFAYHAPSK